MPLNSQAIEATPMKINISPEKVIDGWKMKLPSKHGPFSGDMLIFANIENAEGHGILSLLMDFPSPLAQTLFQI